VTKPVPRDPMEEDLAMRIAYLDVFAGISGDMTLGALVDAGVDLQALRDELAKVPMHGWRIESERASKSGISGTLVSVVEEEAHGHHHEGHDAQHHGRSCRELVDMIEASHLAPEVVSGATAILWRIADAEAKIHGTTREQVHFHELGGLDSIIDIVGAVVGFRLLGVERIYCSAIPLSHGFVDCAHGRLPVPAPATIELLRGIPTFGIDVDGETVTPTGAGIAAGLCQSFGVFPAMTVQAIGYGCGHKDFPGVPNVLRLVVGERSGPMAGIEGGEGEGSELVADRVKLVEANIDDMNPEFFGRVSERAFSAGAADVWTAPITMKRGRPATQLSAIVDAAKLEAVVTAILEESTTFGVRVSEWERRCLPRTRVEVDTTYGVIRVKLARLGDRVLTASPEYADCAAAAERTGAPLKEIYASASAAARALRGL
jgi:pyridinium-3,5-bisthiocarboxylic acid mononucleotide nickel chelatase